MVVTVGFFDGVHLGHRRVLRSLLEYGEEAAVVTFWPHPRVVLQKDAFDLQLLNTMEEKTEKLREAGIDDIRCVEFTRGLASSTAGDFIRDYLIGRMGCTTLVLGYDNRIGSDGMGTAELAELASGMGLRVETVPSVVINDMSVSSTRIRQMLRDGDVSGAASMLGYRYSIAGIVVPGNRIGRTIGFPTANIKPSFPMKLVPADGVYATDVTVNGKVYRGMTNIGVRPTVTDSAEKVIETNIFDFDEDIYGMEIRLDFIARVRSEKKFASLPELMGQLDNDRHRCYGYN